MATFAARQAPSTRPRPRSPRCPPRAARSSPPCARAGAPAGPASHLPARPGAPRSHAQACQTATWGARFPPAPEFGARTTDQLEAASEPPCRERVLPVVCWGGAGGPIDPRASHGWRTAGRYSLPDSSSAGLCRRISPEILKTILGKNKAKQNPTSFDYGKFQTYTKVDRLAQCFSHLNVHTNPLGIIFY